MVVDNRVGGCMCVCACVCARVCVGVRACVHVQYLSVSVFEMKSDKRAKRKRAGFHYLCSGFCAVSSWPTATLQCAGQGKISDLK